MGYCNYVLSENKILVELGSNSCSSGISSKNKGGVEPILSTPTHSEDVDSESDSSISNNSTKEEAVTILL